MTTQAIQRFWAYPNAPDRAQLLMVLQRHHGDPESVAPPIA